MWPCLGLAPLCTAAFQLQLLHPGQHRTTACGASSIFANHTCCSCNRQHKAMGEVGNVCTLFISPSSHLLVASTQSHRLEEKISAKLDVEVRTTIDQHFLLPPIDLHRRSKHPPQYPCFSGVKYASVCARVCIYVVCVGVMSSVSRMWSSVPYCCHLTTSTLFETLRSSFYLRHRRTQNHELELSQSERSKLLLQQVKGWPTFLFLLYRCPNFGHRTADTFSKGRPLEMRHRVIHRNTTERGRHIHFLRQIRSMLLPLPRGQILSRLQSPHQKHALPTCGEEYQ